MMSDIDLMPWGACLLEKPVRHHLPVSDIDLMLTQQEIDDFNYDVKEQVKLDAQFIAVALSSC